MVREAAEAVPMGSQAARTRIQAENQARARSMLRMKPLIRLPMPAPRTVASIAGALLLAASGACKPMKPRPTPTPPPAPAEPAKTEAPTGPTERKSHLGKSMDAAERTRDRINAYQDEVSKQADEVFKNP